MRKIVLILTLLSPFLFSQKGSAQVVLHSDTVSVQCGNPDVFLVPVRVKDFTDIAALQYTYQWNPAHLGYAYISDINPNLPNAAFDTTSLISQGKFTFAWTTLGGVSLPDDEILLNVVFTRIGGPATPLSFVNDPTDIFAFDATFTQIDVIARPGRVVPLDQSPPSLTCPPNATAGGTGPTPVNNIGLTAVADDCGIDVTGWSVSGATTGNFPTDSDASGALFNLGESQVVYTVTDIAGNTATCSFTVTVDLQIGDDLTLLPVIPSATCGELISIPITAYNFDTIAALQFSMGWNPAQLQYNSVSNLNPALNLAQSNFGIGNTSNGEFSFGWTGPFNGLTLPDGDILFFLNVTVLGQGDIDFTDIPTTITAFSGVSFPPDEIPVVTVNQTVLVDDTEPPSITCPANVTVQAPAAIVVNNIAPAAISDNCALPMTGWMSTGASVYNEPADPDASGALFNQGTTIVTYSVTDVAGATSTCSFEVQVDFGTGTTDLALVASSASASCGAAFSMNISVLNFNQIAGLQFSAAWDTALVDFVSVSNLNSTLNLNNSHVGTGFTDLGELSFSWTGSLNGSTLSDGSVLFTINFILKGNMPATISFTDNPTLVQAFSGASFPPEEVPVALFNGAVSVLDNEPPVITCPADITADAAPGTLTAFVGGLQPAAMDNCGGAVSVSYVTTGSTNTTGNGPANGNYSAGLTTVTYTASDAAGNTVTCSFTVTVNADTPVELSTGSFVTDCNGPDTITTCVTVNGFADIIGVQFNLNWDETVLKLLPPFTNGYPGMQLDNSMFFNYSTASAGDLVFFGGSPAWPNIPQGDTMFCLKFEVINASGFTAIDFVAPFEAVRDGTFSLVPVTVNSGSFDATGDLTPPKIVCPDDQLLSPLPGECGVIYFPVPVSAFDECGELDTVIVSPDNGVFNSGQTVVTLTATDVVGFTSSCTFVVTVEDTAPPVIVTCPADITVEAAPGECSATGNWSDPVFSDCTNLTLSSNLLPGDQLPPCSPSTVIYEATDEAGNTATCEFNVLVIEVTPPSVTCPDDIVVDVLSGCDTVVTFADAVVSDLCDSDPDLGSDYDSGEVFPAGTTTVTFAAFDECSNFTDCSFNITVRDAQPPLLSGCPSDTVIILAPDECSVNVNWIPPTATDICDAVVEITSTDTPGSNFQGGVPITVTYTATDDSGNTSTCEFKVELQDVTAPVLNSCPSALIYALLPPNECDTTLTWTPPTADDACNVTLVSNFMPGDVFLSGDTIVTYTATDASGNTATCSFQVVVEDKIPPVLVNCPPSPAPVTLPPGTCKIPVNWVNPTATDNCTTPVVDVPVAPGSEFGIGTTEITITATDASNNQDTCKLTITVNGFPPGIDPATMPANVMVNGCDTTLTWMNPTAVGFCGSVTITSDVMTPATFGQGIHVVTFTATDGANVAMASFTVTVTDNQDPVITCPPTVEVNVAGVIVSGTGFITMATGVPGCDSVELEFALPAVTDNCLPAPQLVQTSGQDSGELFPVGSHELKFLATDAAGNTSECVVSVEITPVPAPAPVADPNPGCKNETITITATDVPGAVYTWVMLPGLSLGETSNTYVIDSLKASNAGKYTASYTLNGCASSVDTVDVQFVAPPVPESDMYDFPTGVNDTIFNVILNDGVDTADYEICNILPASLPDGLTYLGKGKFKFSDELGEDISFAYQICYCGLPGDMSTVTIRVFESDCSFIPNLLTPNGDGLNDWLVIPCVDSPDFMDNSIVIYNQWGDLVFEDEGYTNDPNDPAHPAWQGTFKNEPGKDLPDGVYFYVFKPASDALPIKGFVQINR